MWFKNITLFQYQPHISYAPEHLTEQLEAMAFTPCLPSLPSSRGWVPPIGDHALVHGSQGYMLLCLQIEERVLPAAVVNQALKEQVREIEQKENRKLPHKHKLALKDEIIQTLLPKAFTKIHRVNGYIDTKQQRLVIDSTSSNRIDQFITLLKKAIPEVEFRGAEVTPPAPILTSWLRDASQPANFAIDKRCVLRDPNEQGRVIRIQQQDLFASSLQALFDDNCQVERLALNWCDRIDFSLTDDFQLRSLKFHDEVLDLSDDNHAETEEQQAESDFFIMGETVGQLLDELLQLFAVKKSESNFSSTVTAPVLDLETV